jgi:glyoxylase-like metal-dependent hydrolase (beta-lactamase superfamily II)
MQFNDLEIDIVSDGIFYMDGGGLFGLVPKLLWEQVATPDDKNRVRMTFNCLLIRSREGTILVNTGLGSKLGHKGAKIFGVDPQRAGLLDALAHLGVAPEDVDIVINTHLHADHCGGNTRHADGEVVPTFPRAEYWIQRLEWADAILPNERTRATYLADNFLPLERRGQVRILHGDTRVSECVHTVITRGHTRAHQSVLIESGGKKAFFLSDLAPFPVHIERLAWVPAFDVEPLETIETKRRLQRWAVDEKALLIFEHAVETPLGYLREESEGRYYVESLSEDGTNAAPTLSQRP